MKRNFMVISFLVTVFIWTAAPVAAENLNAFVSILPQKYFLEKIGGDHVDIHVMVPPGAHPATFEPSPKQITALSGADIYFAIGVPFESSWMGKIQSVNHDLEIIHTDKGIERKTIDRHGGHDHHGHGSLDPHIWLSPPLVKIQAGHTADGLISADPENRETYEKNLDMFLEELTALDLKLRDRLKNSVEFMVFHPSWGYFADAYGLKQVPVEVEGKSPKAAELARLIRYAQEHDIRTVLVQPQFSSRDAEMIARAINGKTVIADPLSEDWADNLLRVADRIQEK